MKATVNKKYEADQLAYIAYPMGGLGAGMFCLEGTGALSQFSFRHTPNAPNEPNVFAALAIKDGETVIPRVLEGPVPRRKIWNNPELLPYNGKGNGLSGRNYGLPRFEDCRFSARFPFAHIELADNHLPVQARIEGWSPFIPGDDLNSGLPGAFLEYTIKNTSGRALECVFYFAAFNLMSLNNGSDTVTAQPDGFTLTQSGSKEKPWEEGHLQITAEHAGGEGTFVDTAWFRGGWFDTFTMLWNNIKTARYANRRYTDEDSQPQYDPRPKGGSLAVPLSLAAGESKTVKLQFSWYVPNSNLRRGNDPAPEGESSCCCGGDCGGGESSLKETYKPWYATQFDSVNDVSKYLLAHADELHTRTLRFTDTLHASALPDALLEAVDANLSILKSPTVLRQQDGRLWCWEGCCECEGCCEGTCTHVWNYAQAICHLFPKLERGLRKTEFNENQDKRGHQQFRAMLPIRPTPNDFHAAADGQLGGIMKVYRDWRISGDTAWMTALWPKVKESLEYCISEWDPDQGGVVREPHHNTYDIEFYGVEPMCTTVYLGALEAAARMARAAGGEADAARYDALREKGAAYLAEKLFNGEYMEQEADFSGTGKGETPVPAIGGPLSPEAVALIQQEGPKYQYGKGCLSDGVIGSWMATLYGLGDVMKPEPVRSHLQSIFKYNLKEDLSEHENTQRPGYALGKDGGLLLCTWPRGGKLSLPFVYSDEVWTGIEYQVASHLICEGFVTEGVKVVETCRARYDGSDRNPFDEYECGHWYARALASYALLQSYAGARYDKLTRTLYIKPAVTGNVQALFSFDGGYGLAGVRDGKAFFEPVEGELVIEHLEYTPK